MNKQEDKKPNEEQTIQRCDDCACVEEEMKPLGEHTLCNHCYNQHL